MERSGLRSCIVFVLTLMLGGCLAITPEQIQKANREAAAQNSDRYLAEAFLEPSFKPDKHTVNIYEASILIRRYNITVGGSPSECVTKYLKGDSSRDRIAVHYVTAAKKRGNTVKLYSAKLNEKVRRLFRTPTLGFRGRGRFDLDPALIEFDGNGRIVSVLVRFNAFETPLASTLQTQHSTIYLGEHARHIEMQVNKRILEDNFMQAL